MDVFLIKIGKVCGVLKRDGLSGLSRIFAAWKASRAPIGSGDILLISGGVGDSARYRTTHVAEELGKQGLRCDTTTQSNGGLTDAIDRFDIFVFHRVLVTDQIEKIIARIKEQGKAIIFDTDDLVYDPHYIAQMDYLKNVNALEKKLYESGVGGEILHDSYVTHATTTTEFLGSKLRAEGKEVFIVPNKLSDQDIAIANDVLQDTKSVENTDKIRIGYFSGTISHNKDFATITGALSRILDADARVELYIAGPLELEKDFKKRYADRIAREKFIADKKLYFAAHAACDMIVAPLEDNDFTRAKSELKFFEAGIVGVPVVAVDNQTFRGAIEDGVNGFVAGSEQEWEEKLTMLVVDTDLRARLGAAARKIVLNRYTTESTNDAYIDFLRERI